MTYHLVTRKMADISQVVLVCSTNVPYICIFYLLAHVKDNKTLSFDIENLNQGSTFLLPKYHKHTMIVQSKEMSYGTPRPDIRCDVSF